MAKAVASAAAVLEPLGRFPQFSSFISALKQSIVPFRVPQLTCAFQSDAGSIAGSPSVITVKSLMV